MLDLPRTGIQYSANSHNCDIAKVADWLEATVIFDQKRIAISDVVDLLIENQVYESQDFAREFVDQVWSVVQGRLDCYFSPMNLVIQGDTLIANGDWVDDVALSFCVTLSCHPLFPQWRAQVTTEFTTCGAYFERLTHSALCKIMNGWKVARVGWAPEHPVRITASAVDITSSLAEMQHGERELFLHERVNDLTLDIYSYLPFVDGLGNYPTFFVQCASGDNWKSKRKTPDMEIWQKIISFCKAPTRVLSIPFELDKQEFRKSAIVVDGLLLHRSRLLAANQFGQQWLDNELETQLRDWIQPRVDQLPRAN